MARAHEDLQMHCELLAADLTATLGGDHSRRVKKRARELRRFSIVQRGERLFADVQQQIHDEHIDTTWPACPLHHRHPLWVRDGHWVCEQMGVPIAALGHLDRTPRR